MYKEFRLFGVLFAISGIGIHAVTSNGNFGIKFWNDSVSIKRGFNERFYYYPFAKRIIRESNLHRTTGKG